jgi:hypothetical protein
METLIPWTESSTLIDSHHPKLGNERRPVGLEHVSRMCFIANWGSLADESLKDALYNMSVFRELWEVDLGEQRVPGVTTCLVFGARSVDPATFTVHADLDCARIDQAGELLTGEWTALIGVEDLRGTEFRDRLVQRFDTELRFECGATYIGRRVPLEMRSEKAQPSRRRDELQQFHNRQFDLTLRACQRIKYAKA